MFFRVCVLLFFVQYSLAQDIVTPLLDSLSAVTNESEKSRISLKIASELSTSDWKRAQYYIEVAEEAALDSKSEEVLADFYSETGEIYYHKEALDVALDYYLKAYDYYNGKDLSKKYILENSLAIV